MNGEDKQPTGSAIGYAMLALAIALFIVMCIAFSHVIR